MRLRVNFLCVTNKITICIYETLLYFKNKLTKVEVPTEGILEYRCKMQRCTLSRIGSFHLKYEIYILIQFTILLTILSHLQF